MAAGPAPLRAVLVVALLTYGLVMAWGATREASPRSDFHAFRIAAHRLAAGDRVYFPQLAPGDEMPNKHGLIFLVLIQPLALVGQPLAQGIWVFVSVLLLLHSLWILSRLLAGHGGSFAPWVGLLLVAPFVHTLLKYEQTGLFLLWAMLVGTRALARGRDAAGGCCLGVAAAIKLLPLVFLPWLLFERRLVASAGFLAGLALSVALPAALYGAGPTWSHLADYAGMLARDPARDTQFRFHQSLRPLVLATVAPRLDAGPLASEATRAEVRQWEGTRNFLASPWLFRHREALVLACSLVFVLLVAWAVRPAWGAQGARPPDPPGLAGEVGLVLCAMVLVSPLAWKHYYVWALPAAAWVAARRDRVGIALFALLLTLPHKGLLGRQAALAYQTFHGYAAGLAVVVVWVACRVRRAGRHAGGDGSGDGVDRMAGRA